MEKEVFISYSSRDQQIADELVSVIEAAGVSCWIAHRDIVPGADWADSINTALKNCRVFVLVFSKNSSASVQVSKEITLAVSQNKTVIPYKIDDTALEGKMSYYLCDTHWFDASRYVANDGMTELSRLVVSIASSDEPQPPKQDGETSHRISPSVAPLLKRAYIFLEDGEWASADVYCEKVLDLDPENPHAYVGKLLAELRVRNREDLKDVSEPFDNNGNYQRAFRYGDSELRSELTGCIEHIVARNELARMEEIYLRAKKAMSTARTEKEFKAAAQMFESISKYEDSESLARQCTERVKDMILDSGKAQMNHHTLVNYNSAIKKFESIPGWKDADECAAVCRQNIEELIAKKEAEQKERRLQAKIAREKEERAKKRNRIIIACVCLVAALIIAGLIFLPPIIKYNMAMSLMEKGELDEATAVFQELGHFKDSADKIEEIVLIEKDNKYYRAISLMESGEYDEATAVFQELGHFKDSADKIEEIVLIEKDNKYFRAISLMESGEYDEAYSVFQKLGNHRDSADRAELIRINQTKEQLKNIKIGDCFEFGVYEQDNNTSNGKEKIEWYVLDVKDDKALVISTYGIECKPYNTECINITWGSSTIREWLNGAFLDTAFSTIEKSMIPKMSVPASTPSQGDTTYDRVFLLDGNEVGEYLPSNMVKCKPTEYLLAYGSTYNSTYKYWSWWLRTTYDNEASYIGFDGYGGTYKVDTETYMIRPALWIDINSLDYES
ncbi:MAG: TIR domain-containing protein [Ruminococcaceae bacterium]|nr:TIR domain-containing protein [Oscillospiraceae bacterium]